MRYNKFSRMRLKRLTKTVFAKMVAQVFYCILIFLLSCTTFVQLCPPGAKPVPPQRSSISATDPPATIPTDVMNRKEMLLVPIKGNILTLWRKNMCFTRSITCGKNDFNESVLIQMYTHKSKIIMNPL
jgi:hypothetical protein